MKKACILILLFMLAFTVACTSSSAKHTGETEQNGDYRCTPCGYDCDKQAFTRPGKCPHCQMDLVKASGIGKARSIKPSDVCAYVEKHPNTILLDVRTKDEFEGKIDPELGRLKNAINLPVQELETRIAELDQYKNKEIIVYCSRSHRSPRAAYILSQNGFGKVINMEGGMSTMKDKDCMN